MNKFYIVVIVALLGSGAYSGSINSSVKSVAVSRNSHTIQTRCSLCDGTGFSANSKGEKGKGTYTCVRCKGTGKIGGHFTAVNTSANSRTVSQISHATQSRCSLCDGTGFSANSKGEKGKGTYTCAHCKGTGKIGGFPATVNSSTKPKTINQNIHKIQVRCSLCNGTGFSANSKGEKGKGNFTCTHCKGTGKR